MSSFKRSVQSESDEKKLTFSLFEDEASEDVEDDRELTKLLFSIEKYNELGISNVFIFVFEYFE